MAKDDPHVKAWERDPNLSSDDIFDLAGLHIQEYLEAVWPEHRERLHRAENVLFVFARDGFTVRGRDAMAKTKRLGPGEHRLLRFCAAPRRPQFMIIISWRWWYHSEDAFRRALLDHELTHCGADGDVRGHDLEEFAEIVQRHGLWREEIAGFVEVAKQLDLGLDDDTPVEIRAHGETVKTTLGQMGRKAREIAAHVTQSV